tara:strand:- start:3775 stop:4104 length:330 start_codon:yes stop_codon:yes gene_type:complete
MSTTQTKLTIPTVSFEEADAKVNQALSEIERHGKTMSDEYWHSLSNQVAVYKIARSNALDRLYAIKAELVTELRNQSFSLTQEICNGGDASKRVLVEGIESRIEELLAM